MEKSIKSKMCISILHSKGGVGKSEIAAMITDWLNQVYGNQNTKIFDNDSQEPKLSSYKTAKAEHIQLFELDDRNNVIPESLDITKMNLIDYELEHGKSTAVLVDNGSPSFQPFLSYFQHDAVEMFKEEIGVDFIHVTIVAADPLTHRAPIELLEVYGDSAKYIIIENEHFGKIDYDTSAFDTAGADFYVLKITKLTKAQEKTLSEARMKNLLLSEAITSKDFSLVEKSRLKKIKSSFEEPFSQILSEFGHGN